MNLYVAVTDTGWFEYLAALQPDEVNFWRPKETRAFRALSAYEPFLFKLRKPSDCIVGGGFFVSYSALPLSVVWDAFEVKNGASSVSDLAEKIDRYRGSSSFEPDPLIGCIVLTSPFFFSEPDWIPTPQSWSPNLIQGKTYSTGEPDGAALWAAVQERLARDTVPLVGYPPADQLPRYGAEMLMHPRLGQGGFRVLVTEAYHRKCAMTGERTLPVLQAAHIKPYSQDGPHDVRNGLLLRSDLHTLLDRGFLTITPDYRVEVSQRIRKQYENGRDYYKMHGKHLVVLPDRAIDRPSPDFIEWHNHKIYAA